MKYVMTAVWGFILTHVLTYVASSMIGVPYNFQTATILAVGLIISVFILGAVSFAQPTEEH